MKKSIAAALAAVSVVSATLVTGCSANLPGGYDKFTAAREKYQNLDSARVTMTDLTTGEEIMRFSFYINVNDEMVFSYWGSWQGAEQQAYSDGAEFFYKDSGDEKWTVIGSDDDSYIYNVYNRGYRYPYAEGRLFFLAGEAVKDAGIIESDDGPTSITYTYDPDKLNAESMPGVQEDIQSFVELTTNLEIDQQGYPVSFTEDGTVITAAGEEMSFSMRIDVTDINNVYDVANPVDEIYKKSEKPTAETPENSADEN